jgi:hypothetical protein
MKVVSFPLELGGGVDLVGHDPGDGLLDVLHPLDHLGLPHQVHVLDERVVLLPERHLEDLTSRPGMDVAIVILPKPFFNFFNFFNWPIFKSAA